MARQAASMKKTRTCYSQAYKDEALALADHVGISAAAREPGLQPSRKNSTLYRKQRKTLYRHIDSGRLSCTTRGDGHRVIDLAELMRCYSSPLGPMLSDDSQVTRDAP